MRKYKNKYIFESHFVKHEKAAFTTYMLQQHFAKDTIRSYTNYVAYFLNFLEQQRLSPKETTYNHIIEFIGYCRKEGVGNHLVNRMLVSVRLYYKYLGQAYNTGNPAAGVYIHGETKPVPHLLEYMEIEEAYKNYRVYDNRTHRNKVIIGLLLYQGLTTGELHKLEVNHINLQEGKIFIPGGRTTNSRVLKLQPQQILELHQYIKEIRPQINGGGSKQLLVSVNGLENIKNSLLHLTRALQKTNPNIRDSRQIRVSVITHWLKTIDVRKVQYMAGYRRVCSAEKYKQYDLKELQEQLKKFHPLN